MEEIYDVTIVIPTFKRPDTLSRAIESVLNQTYKKLDVVVVDDNNPDSEGRKLTEEVMLTYRDNPRVKYIQHPYNKNGSAARNTGAKSTNAYYIGFLDDDDVFLPGKIESQVRRLNELDASYGCCYSKYASKVSGAKLIIGKENKEGYLYVEALCRELYTMAGSNLLIKKEAFNEINGFDESFTRHQDVEFLTRLLQKYKMAYDSQLGLIVNIHVGDCVVDYQKVLKQYEDIFAPYLSNMDATVKKRFYKQINIQRFWDFLRTKHDVKACWKLISNGDVTFINALSYTIRMGIDYAKRKM